MNLIQGELQHVMEKIELSHSGLLTRRSVLCLASYEKYFINLYALICMHDSPFRHTVQESQTQSRYLRDRPRFSHVCLCYSMLNAYLRMEIEG